MSKKIVLLLVVLAVFVAAAMGESAIERLKSQIENNVAAAPCDKAAAGAAPSGPAPPKQFLDQRLPHVVDDYHPPVGGFNPSHIPDKEVDVAARKILREIEVAEAEAKANGLPTPGSENKAEENGVMTTEEHKFMKQLLLDADILVRAAAKSLSENGPVEEATVKKVAKSAVKKAASAAKKQAKKEAKKEEKKAKKEAKKAKKEAKKAEKKAKKEAKKAVKAEKKAAKAAKKEAKKAAKEAKKDEKKSVGAAKTATKQSLKSPKAASNRPTVGAAKAPTNAAAKSAKASTATREQ